MRMRNVIWGQIAALVMALAWAHPAQATVFFDDDFEAPTDLRNWTMQYGDGSVAVTTDAHNTGTQSLEMVFSDPVNSSGGGVQLFRNFTPGTTAFFRMYYRTSPGFQMGSNGDTKIVRFSYSGGGINLWIFLGGNRYALYNSDAYDAGPGCSGNITSYSSTPASSSSFDLVELEIVLNTITNGVADANGAEYLWVNGNLVLSLTGRRFIGPAGSTNSCGTSYQPNIVVDAIQFFRQSGLGTMYIDRVAVGNARIGPVGSAATAPPQAPTGLAVR